MDRSEYVQTMQDLLSQEPPRVRDANRKLYHELVPTEAYKAEDPDTRREADLVLAEVAS